MEKESLFELFVVTIATFMVILIGLVIGLNSKENEWQQRLIEEGHAKWEVNPKSGATQFVLIKFKTEEESK